MKTAAPEPVLGRRRAQSNLDGRSELRLGEPINRKWNSLTFTSCIAKPILSASTPAWRTISGTACCVTTPARLPTRWSFASQKKSGAGVLQPRGFVRFPD